MIYNANIALLPKIHSDLLWDLTMLFGILGGVYFAFIFLFRNRISKTYLKTIAKRKKLAPIISNFLFHSDTDPESEQRDYVKLKIEIREYLNDRRFQKILADILFDLQKDVSGETQERLFRLFKEMGLHHDSIAKLRSWHWPKVSKGILELAQMQVSVAYEPIKAFVNDKRRVVRKQAELALVAMNKGGIEFLLDTTTYTISEWQQLKLIEAMARLEDFRPPKFKTWLTSENRDVVLFSLRLIKHYNQREAVLSIIELTKHKEDVIKIAAVQCIAHFGFTEALEPLKQVFWGCQVPVKIQILTAVSKIGGASELEFLYQVKDNEQHFSVASKAMGAINTIRPDSVLPTKDILDDLSFSDLEVHEETVVTKTTILDTTKTDNDFPKPDEKETSPLDIEVQEVEVFDVIESPLTQPQIAKIPEEADPATPFELEPLSDDMDEAVNHSLNLIPANESAPETPDDQKEDFSRLTTDERISFVNDHTKTHPKQKTDFLEFVVENDGDSEVRYQAFKNIKQANKPAPEMEETVEENDGDTPSMAEDSIFYSLFNHASDEDSKEILIKELIELADHRDLPFLYGVAKETSNTTLSKLVQKTISIFEPAKQQFDEVVTKVRDTAVQIADLEVSFTEIKVEKAIESEASRSEKLPLELCFLYDELGIKPSKEEDTGFDFELSDEFYLELRREAVSPKNQEQDGE